MHDIGEIVDVEFTLQLQEGTMRSKLPVPSGAVTLTDLLPILQNFTSGIAQHAAGVTAQNGAPVTCGPNCGACCRQLVPISSFEAEGLARWIRSLPQEQQLAIEARFHNAILSLQQSGVLSRLTSGMFELSTEAFAQLGLEYFAAGVPCPFLVDESCSIHPIRPLICREYMVVSPPQFCAEPQHARVQGVRLPLHPSRAMMRLGKRIEADPQGWLPLVFLFHWMAANIDAGSSISGPGPDVLRQFIDALTQQ